MEKKYSLPKEFAEKWVAALRSGDYDQGTGELTVGREDKKEFAYCCLGVACKSVGMPDNSLHPYSSLGQAKHSETNVFKLSGIPIELIGTDLEASLMDINDYEDYTFLEIADWIEEHVEFYN